MRASPRTHYMASQIYYIDSVVRNDLARGDVTSENDYSSNLCGAIRHYPFWLLGLRKPDFVHSRLLTKPEEMFFGCDGIILFRILNSVKIGLFEAKWPRIRTGNHPWDYISQSQGESHFHSQLVRQHVWRDSAAIWEMFYYEYPVGEYTPPFDKYGSTCAWHDVAYDYDAGLNHALCWTDEDLIQMLQRRPTDLNAQNYGTNLRHIILQVLLCQQGVPYGLPDNGLLLLKGDKNEVNIPLPDNPRTREQIPAFMEKRGLSTYAYFDLEDGFDYKFE